MYDVRPTARLPCAGVTTQEGFLEEELGHPDALLLLPFTGRVSVLTDVATPGFLPAHNGGPLGPAALPPQGRACRPQNRGTWCRLGHLVGGSPQQRPALNKSQRINF